MFEDAYLDTYMEDHISGGFGNYEPDDLEMFNQAEADDYRHDFDDECDDDFDEWDGQFDDADFGEAAWDEVDF